MPFDDMVGDLLRDPDFGQAATFKPKVGTNVTCYVILTKEISNQPLIGDGQAWESGLTIEYQLSDVGIEADRDDMFDIGSTEYVVRRILENDGLTVKVAVIESYS